MTEIKIENLNKYYGKVHALKDVSLEIEKNSLFGLLGINGAGKTTLIKILTCLSVPQSGKAEIEGISVTENPDEIKKIVDVSPQETAVAPNLTVKENLDFFASLYSINDDEYVSSIVEAFSLDEVLNRKTKTLSGGWKRRVSIAIGIISKPKVLFLDEPTLGLDVIARRELRKIIRKLKGETTIILTTHYLEEAETLCDKVAIMANGKVCATGTPSELIAEAETNNFEDAFIKITEGEL